MYSLDIKYADYKRMLSTTSWKELQSILEFEFTVPDALDSIKVTFTNALLPLADFRESRFLAGCIHLYDEWPWKIFAYGEPKPKTVVCEGTYAYSFTPVVRIDKRECLFRYMDCLRRVDTAIRISRAAKHYIQAKQGNDESRIARTERKLFEAIGRL